MGCKFERCPIWTRGTCEGCEHRLIGWKIEKNVKPIPSRLHDFDFWHENYDGADGGNGLAGTASSREDAIEQIEEIESNW